VAESDKWEDLIHRTDSRDLIIRFDEIFNQPDIDHMNDFYIRKKKNFSNTIDDVVESVQIGFRNTEDIDMEYLTLKYKMIKEEISTEDELYDYIKENILTDELLETFSNFVEENYQIDLEDVEDEDVINESLQINNKHGKCIYKSAYTIRFIAPLITEFYNIQNTKVDKKFLMRMFHAVYEKFNTDDIDLFNKLHKFVQSRVVTTQYSDRKQWNFFKRLGLSSKDLISEIYEKILINSIPKGLIDQNIVNYFAVVIRRSISYFFQRPYESDYSSINLNYVDSDGLSNLDKLEINMERLDEGEAILKRLNIDSTIKTLLNRFDFTVTKEELDYYMDNVKINKLQTNLVFLFYSRHMGSYKNLYNCTKEEYIVILILMYKYLDNNGFSVLNKYLTGIPYEFNPKKMKKKRFVEDLVESKKFLKLMNYKYKYVNNIMVDSGVITKMISTINNNEFYHLPPLEEAEDGMEAEYIDYGIKEITNELLRFIEII
jgi:hypothetical protein